MSFFKVSHHVCAELIEVYIQKLRCAHWRKKAFGNGLEDKHFIALRLFFRNCMSRLLSIPVVCPKGLK